MSRLVRHRDTEDGYGDCCTCGATCAYEELDAGHWWPRGWWSVRWDEFNIHAQCHSCNRPLESWNRNRAAEMFDKHAAHVRDMHGQEEVDRLNALVQDERRGNFRRMTLVEVRTFCYGLAANCRAEGLPDD